MRTKLIVGSLSSPLQPYLPPRRSLIPSIFLKRLSRKQKSNLAKCFGLIQGFRYQAKSPATAVTIFPQTVQIRSLFLLVTPEEKGQ